MHILQICNKSPYPPNEGGSIAMNAITQALIQANYRLKVIAVSTPKVNVDKINIPLQYLKQTGFEYCYIDTNVRIIPAIKCLLSNKSYHIERFISKKFENFLIKNLKENNFDIIQFETIYLAPYVDIVRKYAPNSKLILRAHNIEHLIWERNAINEKNIFKKIYLKHLSKTLKNYELKTLNKFDGIATISDKDLNYFKSHINNIPITTIAFNIQNNIIEKSFMPFNKRSLVLFHVGSMDWMPNLEGIKWFINKVWEIVKLKDENVILELAGRNMPDWIYSLQSERIRVYGEVDDAYEFMGKRKIMIVPLLAGSGIRIKIIEGMAASNVIITTTVGAEGINYANNENIIIANTPKEFAESILWCINNEDKLEQISVNARKFVVENHSQQAVIKNITTFYNYIIANANTNG